MRYAAAEKLEIIRLVEQSSLSVRRTLAQLGIPRSTCYCWYDRYRSHDAEGLEDRTPAPRPTRSRWPPAVWEEALPKSWPRLSTALAYRGANGAGALPCPRRRCSSRSGSWRWPSGAFRARTWSWCSPRGCFGFRTRAVRWRRKPRCAAI